MTQKEALEILKTGANVYLTGSAGSGKTYVLNRYIEWLRSREIEVAVTASTGIAATHMNGQTIHSWSGIGVRESISSFDLEVLESKQNLWKRYQNTKVLIIDEISMLHADRLDMVDNVARMFRRSDEPFGGMQVVLCGDFFQLPPITKGYDRPKYANQSRVWNQMNLQICYLSEQHRHEDRAYIKILNSIRQNCVNEDVIEILMERKTDNNRDIETRLYTHNVDVDKINEDELNKINAPIYIYDMMSKGKSSYVESLKKSCLAPDKLRLKLGASVMFVKNNFEAGYVNGTLGKIVEFANDSDRTPIVETLQGKRITCFPVEWNFEDDGKIKATITQIPLRHAWAITVHKSQGMSLDAATIDLSKSFVAGQGYVALSRVRTLDGLCLLGLNSMALRIDEEVFKFDKYLREKSEDLENRFASLSSDEKKFLEENFVKRAGGIFDEEKIEKNTKKHKKEIKEGKVLKTSTYEMTKDLALGGASIEKIAKERELTISTIISHLEKLAENKDFIKQVKNLKPDKKIVDAVRNAYKKTKSSKLSPIASELDYQISFEDIRLARLFLGLPRDTE